MALPRVIQRSVFRCLAQTDAVLAVRHFSCSHRSNANSYKLVVVGGGSGGCSAAAKFCRDLGGKGNVAVIEPSEVSYL